MRNAHRQPAVSAMVGTASPAMSVDAGIDASLTPNASPWRSDRIERLTRMARLGSVRATPTPARQRNPTSRPPIGDHQAEPGHR